MHSSALAFVQGVVSVHEALGQDRVLEIGSLNVNGSCRPLFTVGAYVGIDRVAGNGVDVVCEAKDYSGEHFNVVISMEALEHASRPMDIVECAYRNLSPYGIFILTCAHETRKPHNCDGSPWSGIEPYNRLTGSHVRTMLAKFRRSTVFVNGEDIYATAMR